MLSPSGRGIPLRAGSPRCCNDRRPGSGSPHPPHGGGSPIRPCLLHPLGTRCSAECNGSPEEQRVPEAWTVGPRSGPRCAHQRGSPARSRLPRPDGLVRTPRLRPRLEWLGAEGRRPRGTHDRGGLADPLLRASSEHLLRCAMREHGGLAWPPRLSALRELRQHFLETRESKFLDP